MRREIIGPIAAYDRQLAHNVCEEFNSCRSRDILYGSRTRSETTLPTVAGNPSMSVDASTARLPTAIAARVYGTTGRWGSYSMSG